MIADARAFAVNLCWEGFVLIAGGRKWRGFLILLKGSVWPEMGKGFCGDGRPMTAHSKHWQPQQHTSTCTVFHSCKNVQHDRECGKKKAVETDRAFCIEEHSSEIRHFLLYFFVLGWLALPSFARSNRCFFVAGSASVVDDGIGSVGPLSSLGSTFERRSDSFVRQRLASSNSLETR